ncbi:hypothetical protein [Streptomyces sp. NBC_01264]|uniref:hypothetical protein n=1 Tax=Streptomyces sp. NBC_01264 TaxID=2903804 RepID=UPI0022594B0D|nr:hypothetical protein [Streptomyces sp. NBC_01264]MCX4782689.1 hypothetical protein [Streptomyces sp. NBC_01264]
MTRRRAGIRLPRALTTLLTLVLPLTAAELLSAQGAAAATPTKPEVVSAGAFEGSWEPAGDGNRPVACNGLMGNSGLALTAGLRDNDGGTVTPQFVVTTAAGAAVPVSEVTTVSSGGTATARVLAKNLPTGSYKWKVRAKDQEGGYSAFTAECAFRVDAKAPTGPVTVTKEDGTALTSQQARTRLRLKFKHAATDLAGFCWSMGRPLSASSTPCAGSNRVPLAEGATEAVVEILLLGQTGSTLYVGAFDKAGNSSPGDAGTVLVVTSPSFVYPAGQTPLNRAIGDLPGDLDGDGFVDLLGPEPDGGLRFYAGNGAGRVQRRVIAESGWKGALIAHGGDFTGYAGSSAAPDGYEDVIARLSDNKLYLYPGNGLGDVLYDTRRELTPPAALGSRGWGRVQQIIAPGDLDQRSGDGFRKGNDLAVVECVDDACSGARLRVYSGRTTADGSADQTKPFDFQDPGYTGGTTWKNYAILGIGDQNGDGVKDVLARNKSDGNLYLYPGKIGKDGRFGLQPRAVYAAGWQPANRPLIVSHGNAQGTVVSKTLTSDGQVIKYSQFQPKAGQEQGDLWATTAADPARKVEYVDSAGKAATTTCPTGCLLFYPGGPAGLKAPLLVGASGWATAVAGLF